MRLFHSEASTVKLAEPQDESLANPPGPAHLPLEAISALDWDEWFRGGLPIGPTEYMTDH
ncbi:hypothetical protein N7471_002467 [Penicillium samsonianum]|uniref:uncharacterized protein n=1 Tax=Penicillium samsonianum TaxID=1882272 RepID=UPI002547F740|nr:uncharacterized protein N7471_002467 [Penicillium samsonianum]KAJ6143014.1 hypothetical protein N7471_002467 [Penicillium samsonianum]